MQLLIVGAICAFTCGLARADFPPPADLPAHEGLPDPLIALDGSRVTTPDEWRKKRAPELRALFEHYMYGRCPAAPERVVGRVLFEDDSAFDGAGTLREVELTFGPPEWPKIFLLIATPNDTKPAACILGPNFGGNHLRTTDARVRVPTAWLPQQQFVENFRATEASRGKQADVRDLWPMAEAIERGYAMATFHCADIQPDRPGVREGMLATTQQSGELDPAATGTIMWWAWGIQRAVDFLVTDERIDAKRIAVAGHSRLGKTALVAGAFDERIALVIANQAGCGGSGPSHHADERAESVAIITDRFPHWFCGNFAKFADEPAKLPFDQNCLVALCAPRPVLFNAAENDVWANPSGQFEVLRAATPVYDLLGVKGLEADAMPKPGDPLITSRLGYKIRPGNHAMGPEDWETFFAFADKWLTAP